MRNFFFVNILSIIIIILFLEIIVRAFDLVGLQGYDKNLFYSENGVTLSKANTKLKIFGKFSKTDINGFRIPINNYDFDKNKESILIFGDSVSFGVGIEEKNSFIGLTRSEIDKNLLNSSLSGHNLESYYYLIKKYNEEDKIQFKDAVIFLCLNDIIQFQGIIKKNSKNISKKKTKFFEKNILDDIAIRINIFFRGKSALFVFLKGLLTNPAKRHYELMSQLYERQENIEDYKNYISNIKNYSRQHNINIKFVLLPYAYQIKNNCRENLMKPQKEIRKIFKQKNLKLLDYSSNFCNETEKNKLFLPYDPVHLSLLGHKFVSKLIINDKIF